MAIAKIFAALEPLLPGVALLGPDKRGSHDAAPTIRWRSMSASHHPPRRINGGPKDDGPLWQREIAVPIEIWADTEETVEQLLVLFVNMVHLLLSQFGYQLGGEQWAHEGPMTPGVTCTLVLLLNLPLPRLPRPTVKLTQVDLRLKIGSVDEILLNLNQP